jgi:O-antigen ligase
MLDPAIFYSLLALILLVAIPYGTVESWWEALFEGIIFFLGVLWAIEGMLRWDWLARGQNKIFLPLLILSLYMFIQTLPLLPGAAPPALSGLKVWRAISADPFETRLSVLKLLALILAGMILMRYTSTPRRLRALIFTIIGVGLLSAFFGILRQTTQHSPGFFLPFLQPASGYGQFINRNHFAFLMEMALGLTLGIVVGRGVRREQILIYLALAVPIWTALILCNSRGAIFSMLAQTLLLSLLFTFRRGNDRERESQEERALWSRIISARILRLVLIAGLITMVFLGAIWIGGEPLTSRLETVSNEVGAAESNEGVRRQDIWRATWELIKDHPLLGVGFNGYWAAIPLYHHASGEATPQQAHNDYLEILASGGVIGVLLTGWFLVLLLKAIRRSFQSGDTFRRAARMGACTGLFGVAVHSSVDFGLHSTINALVFTALVVIATLSDPIKREEA